MLEHKSIDCLLALSLSFSLFFFLFCSVRMLLDIYKVLEEHKYINSVLSVC